MDVRQLTTRQSVFITLFAVSLLLAGVVSPFASQHPDGLDRVSQDLKFDHQADPQPLAEQLPSAQVFQGYEVRQAPSFLATPLAGLLGTGLTFGLAWGVGKLATRRSKGVMATPPTNSDH